jgi:hypothetical protein
LFASGLYWQVENSDIDSKQQLGKHKFFQILEKLNVWFLEWEGGGQKCLLHVKN